MEKQRYDWRRNSYATVTSSARKLNQRRLAVANRLFEGYDADRSGTLEYSEFMPLMQRYDTSVDAEAMKTTFQVAGGTDGDCAC